ncbi:HAMP domain-containing histidine kinase [Candidatus Daviesbacteria bacterium]|nr:HAMP domain-containing histidine kinase [Candidatus Daviesbacteria bacterium]
MKLAYFQKRNRLKRYGFSVIVTTLLFSLFILLPKEYLTLINNQTISLLVLILVVTASSWYGGLGPGLLATFLTTFINYFTILKIDSSSHPETGDLFITFVYIIVGFLISLISEVRYEAEFQKDEFIAMAAHEIKNPLNTIKGYACLLQKKIKASGKNKISEYADEIDTQADRLLELINDLLDVTKIEVGKFIYKDELFDLDSLTEEIINHQRIANIGKVITLTGSTHKIIKADRYRIGQVITNLLTNAIKYSPQKSPIKIRLKSKKDGVILTVKDYGIGIPRPEQKAIFKHFYRSQRTRQRKIEGLGLGLFISSQIIKHYRGKLQVKSTETRGSTFCLEVPKNY